MLVKACLNGSRDRREQAAVPISPRDLAIDAHQAVAAGAGALHVHPRRADGSETLDPLACGAAITAIRAACPGTPVGLSTGFWIESDSARRLSQVANWTVLPDFVSVNFSEPGILDLCQALIARAIGVEAGLWMVSDAQAFVESGLSGRCLRVLIEPRAEDPKDAIDTATAIEAVLDQHHMRLPRLLHGHEGATWTVLGAALKRGYDIRVGFEDTLHLPDGTRAKNNADLVTAAMRLVRQHGDTPLSPGRALD